MKPEEKANLDRLKIVATAVHHGVINDNRRDEMKIWSNEMMFLVGFTTGMVMRLDQELKELKALTPA